MTPTHFNPFGSLLVPLLAQQISRPGQGIETTLRHSWPWPPWATLLLLIGAGLFVAWIYAREAGGGRRLRWLLAALRLTAIALVVLMMYGWMRHRHLTDLPDIVVLLDDSASMAQVDHYGSARRQRELESRLSDLGLSPAQRLNLAKLLLLQDDATLLDQLQTRYNLKVYTISDTARIQAADERPLAETLLALQADKPSSRLGKALRDVLENQRGRPTAAVVLLTDGITTEGKTLGEVAEYARRKQIPLFTVGLGNDESMRDIRLSDLLVDDLVFLGDLVNFDFKITGTGFAGRRVNVRLRQKDDRRVLAERVVTVEQDGVPKSVRLSFRPPEEGDFEYEVQAEPLEGEANPVNNQDSRLVSVRDEAIRVLLVQEYPSFEFKYLKTLLGRRLRSDGPGKAIQLTTVLQEADLQYASQDETAQRVFPVRRDELFQYDVIIFGDVNPSHLSRSVMTNIAEFVTERGGGLVVVAGPRHTPLAYRDTPLAPLMPIQLETATVPDPSAALTEPQSIALTTLGLNSPQMQLEDTVEATRRVWQNLPGVYWLLEATDLRPAAHVLAEHPARSGAAGQPLPVICMQFVGAGKVVFHATDESYRWARYRGSEIYYARYWLQTIRYLSRGKLLGKTRAAELTSDREQYRRGEPVRLRVRFFDDRSAPPQDDGVAVVVEQDGGKRRTIRLRRDATSRGIFEGSVSNLAEGSYRAWMATPAMDGPPPARQFSIVAPPGEQARLEMDAADLQRAAEVSDGKFHTFQTARRLLRDLPRGRQVRIENLPPEPIWNSSLLAAAFVLVISSEWLLRKRAGML